VGPIVTAETASGVVSFRRQMVHLQSCIKTAIELNSLLNWEFMFFCKRGLSIF